MGAKDTVMSEEQMIMEVCEGRCPNLKRSDFECRDCSGMLKRTARAQAEISFKAGQEERHSISTIVDVGNDAFKAGEEAGTRKVVEWIKENRETPLGKDQYGYYIWETKLEAQLKVWGIK